MAHQAVVYDEWECEFDVNYREEVSALTERTFQAACQRTSAERWASESRHRRRSQGMSGMHRRGGRRREM